LNLSLRLGPRELVESLAAASPPDVRRGYASPVELC